MKPHLNQTIAVFLNWAKIKITSGIFFNSPILYYFKRPVPVTLAPMILGDNTALANNYSFTYANLFIR